MRAAGLLVMLAATACVRDPAEAICPDVTAGDLVVTEVRGPQSPEDALGPWIEVYNASGRALDLIGTKVRFRRLDDSAVVQVLVRRALAAAPGDYTVLGLFDDADPPSYVDYGFRAEYHENWLSTAAVQVEACGVLIDRASYDSLPGHGTYSLGGAPDADRNDLPIAWCTDGTQVGTTFPGTPQNPNIACP